MSRRINRADLQAVVDRLNRTTNNPLEPWTRTDAGVSANVGNFHLDQAYGGMSLSQMVNENGGVRDVLMSGHIPFRDLYERMHCYIRGIDDGYKMGSDAVARIASV